MHFSFEIQPIFIVEIIIPEHNRTILIIRIVRHAFHGNDFGSRCRANGSCGLLCEICTIVAKGTGTLHLIRCIIVTDTFRELKTCKITFIFIGKWIEVLGVAGIIKTRLIPFEWEILVGQFNEIWYLHLIGIVRWRLGLLLTLKCGRDIDTVHMLETIECWEWLWLWLTLIVHYRLLMMW